jgi:hypothetical protein
MIIRPTNIIAAELISGDSREFGHTLNQDHLIDQDCIIPVSHKGQIITVHRKDLSPGMSPWSAYTRSVLGEVILDPDYMIQ